MPAAAERAPFSHGGRVSHSTSTSPARLTARSRSSASGSANCSPTNAAAKRPPRISPRVSILRNTTNMSRHAGASVSRAAISRNTTPHRCSSWRAKRSTYSVAAPSPFRSSAQRPGACLGRALPAPALAAPPVRIDQRSQVFEAVGRDQAGGHKFPQRVFYFAGKAFGISHQVVEERCALSLKRRKHCARGMRQCFRRLCLRRRRAASRRPLEGRAPAAQRA